MLKTVVKASFFVYQGVFRNMTPSCRYIPSCSQYALNSVEKHGTKGLWYALLRILSCHPLSKRPIYDPA